MYGNRFWHKGPFWLIPASLLWAGLEILLKDSRFMQRIFQKYPRRKRRIEKIFHIVCACLAYFLTVLFVILFRLLTGIDLFELGAVDGY